MKRSFKDWVRKNFSANKTSGTILFSVQFIDLSTSSPTSWTWVFGDGEISTLPNPVHQYTKAGFYSVILLAQNKGYCGNISKPGYINLN